MRREILPATPLALSKRYRNNRLTVTLVFGIAAVLFFGGGAGMLIGELRALAREQAIWDKGVTCEDGSLKPQLADDTELAVTCREADGRVHTGTLTLYGMSYDAALAGETIEVRYDPDAPDEFAISTGIARMDQRRGAVYGGGGTAGVFGLVLGAFALWFWRKLAIARRLARAGDEGVAHVVRVTTKMRKGVATHVRRVYWKLDPAESKPRKTTMDANHGLAWLSSHEPKALALVHGKHALLLAGDLSPVELASEQDKKQALERLERDGGGLPRGLSEVADWIVLSPPAAKQQ